MEIKNDKSNDITLCNIIVPRRGNLKDGVVVHGNSQYEQGMELTEMGCTKVILSGNGDIPRDNPNDRVPHYKRGQET